MLLPGKYFRAEEFACRDGTPYPADWISRWIALRDLCDVARELWGGPLIVVSGYRTPRYNADLFADAVKRGSHQVASSSLHISGDAADLRTRQGKVDVPHLLRVMLTSYEDDRVVLGHRVRELLGGIGDYPESGWVHLDTHKPPDGHLRRWHGR